MKLMCNSEVRSYIKSYLKKHKKNLGFIDNENNQKNIGISDLDSIGALILERMDDSRKDTREYLGKEMSLAYLGIKTLGVLSLCIDRDGEENKPIKEEWIEKNRPNPNFIFEKLIIQLTNYSLSVLQLIEAGLESSAKPLIRSIYELCSLILVLLIDKEKMNLYVQVLERPDERKLWSKHFRFHNLNKILVKLDKELGFPEDIINKMESTRLSVYGDYSQSLHNSYINSIISAYSVSSEDDQKLEINLFGKYSSHFNQVLHDLNLIFFYFIGAMQSVLKKYHDFEIPVDKEMWTLYINLTNCYVNTYFYVTYYEEVKDRISI